MRVLHDRHGNRPAPALVVLLPGALQQPEEYLAAGFADAVRAQGLPLDLAFVDTGLRYISDSVDGTVLDRLQHDVLAPAAQENYREIWLGGASIGGLIAIAHAARHPRSLAGLCLLAPYPGSRILMAEIDAAGGLDCWHAGATDGQAGDAETGMWHWLAEQRGAAASQVYLGLGRDDRFADGHARMAQALAIDADIVDGGHDWAAWRILWDRFLMRHAAHFRQLAARENR